MTRGYVSGGTQNVGGLSLPPLAIAVAAQAAPSAVSSPIVAAVPKPQQITFENVNTLYAKYMRLSPIWVFWAAYG